MSQSLGKRVLKWTLLIAPWVLACGLAAGWALTQWTPGYLERLVPQLAADIGLPLEEFHIRDAGLFAADIGPVRVGAQEDGLRLNNVRVTYTPASLKQKRVNDVILDGVSLSCAYDGTTFTLPILDLLPKSEDSKKSDNTLPDLPFDSIVIRDSVLHCDYGGKHFSIPFSATVTPGETLEFTATLTPRDQTVTVSGSFGPTMNDLLFDLKTDTFRIDALTDLLPLPMGGNVTLGLSASVNLSSPESLAADITASITNAELPGQDIAFASGVPLSLKASVAEKKVRFSLNPIALTAPYPATLTIPEGNATADSLAANFSVLAAGIEIPGQIAADRTNETWAISLTAANPDALTVETGGRAIKLAGFDCAVTGTINPDEADMTVTAATKGARLADIGLRTGAAHINLPLKWPAPKQHTSGKLRVSGLRYDAYNLGTVVAALRQESMGLTINGTLFSQLLPNLKLTFSGTGAMDGPQADFSFEIDDYVLPADYEPTVLFPDLKNLRISGTLATEGSISIRNGDIASQLGVFFTGGRLVIGEKTAAPKDLTIITGIRTFFEAPDLIHFRSAPAQFFAFDSLKAGPLDVTNGKITFQLEPRGVVLVERMGLNWCGGKVESRAFRVVPGRNEYDVTLFCSQLRLSSILSQLGLAEAQGEAALSGELPVTWKKGKISFNNGFLHSTPGQGGTIQVEAMQDLVNSIPEGTQQRGQLELAQAAVKDFEYKWVRIKADTVGDELLVQLSVDGKPASPLPFVYKKEFGGFAKVTGDFKGSNFQGLKLDVNFSLPLDRILLYKDIIGMIE